MAAYGLGRPRMLYYGDQGQLYITRRDDADVLMLQDDDGDKKFEDLSQEKLTILHLKYLLKKCMCW